MPSVVSLAVRGPFERYDGVREWEVEAAGVQAVKVSRELWRFPGVELKTEYSSAKRGVQVPGSASRLSW